MATFSRDQRRAVVQYAELTGAARASWRGLTQNKRDLVLSLTFVKRWHGVQIFFDHPYYILDVDPALTKFLNDLLKSSSLRYGSSQELAARGVTDRLQAQIERPAGFRKLNFGDDVAERDEQLLQYFVSTRAFGRANDGSASVIIGPKGSGKTAILKALQSKRGLKNSIVITPEIFATSMLRQVLESNKGLWDEDQAFVSTWIFTILVEVFKRVSADPKGVPAPALKLLRTFLRDNAHFQDVDLFSRFIGYLKRIESVKVGPYELAIKTRMLQELYSLAPIYELVPKLRGIGGEVLILLDELDQGWDNTQHANRFIGSLLQAAIRIQSLGLRANVVAFLRSEIFDLVKGQLDQLDKLRSGIETLKWSDGELADLIVRRVSHSLAFNETGAMFNHEVASSLFEGEFAGMNGFQYLLSRTSLRPREVLQFMKQAHRSAVDLGETKITAEALQKAEEEFSSWKLEHLCSEYTHIYPGLIDLLWTFRANGPVLDAEEVVRVLEGYRSKLADSLPGWAYNKNDRLLQLLYGIEFLGVPRPQAAKNRSGVIANYEFAFDRRAVHITSAESFLIQPAVWTALEIPPA